jgi:hypothetical protein
MEARRARTGTTTGAGENGHERGQLGREPHTAHERVESLGTDKIRAQCKVRVRMGGRELPYARLKHSIGRTTAAFCDHLQ